MRRGNKKAIIRIGEAKNPGPLMNIFTFGRLLSDAVAYPGHGEDQDDDDAILRFIRFLRAVQGSEQKDNLSPLYGGASNPFTAHHSNKDKEQEGVFVSPDTLDDICMSLSPHVIGCLPDSNIHLDADVPIEALVAYVHLLEKGRQLLQNLAKECFDKLNDMRMLAGGSIITHFLPPTILV
jgi:hypothetical protein